MTPHAPAWERVANFFGWYRGWALYRDTRFDGVKHPRVMVFSTYAEAYSYAVAMWDWPMPRAIWLTVKP